jgi:transposase
MPDIRYGRHGSLQSRHLSQSCIGAYKRLLKQPTTKVYLIVDGHPVHRSRVTKEFVVTHEDRIRLIRLPGYCPEINPDELLNQDVKTNSLGKSPC